MRSLVPLLRLCRSGLWAIVLAWGCTPPPSFPESTPDVADTTEAAPPPAPVLINGRELPLHSSGAADGDAWVLHESGFSGLFLRLEKRAHVAIRVTASGVGQLALVLGDQVQSFSVTTEPKPYEYALDVPSGTHFLRIDGPLPLPSRPASGGVVASVAAPAATELRVANVSVSGAQVLKDASDRSALDAANTFIQNYRKGQVQLRIRGVEPGDAVQIKLMRHAFDFGVRIPGAQTHLLGPAPAAASEAARYQELLLQHFNTVELSSGPKRRDQDPEQARTGLADGERLLAFARANALHVRLHASSAEGDREQASVVATDPAQAADARAPVILGENAHSPARLFGVLQNLSGTGHEISLTELEADANEGVNPERAADIVESTLRLVFGTPAASAVLIGSAPAGAAAQIDTAAGPVPTFALFDDHFAPTAAGTRYEALMKEWDTNLNAPLGADGSVQFAGFYGAYLIQSGGKSGCLSVRKGQTDYELELQPTPRGPNGTSRCRTL